MASNRSLSINGSPFIPLADDPVDVAMERARMLLSEMGWTDPRLVVRTHRVTTGWWIVEPVPYAVGWKVYTVMGLMRACWPCYEAAQHEVASSLYLVVNGPQMTALMACQAGSCPHPEQPRLPPRELLTSPVVTFGFPRKGVSGGCDTPMTKSIGIVGNNEQVFLKNYGVS